MKHPYEIRTQNALFLCVCVFRSHINRPAQSNKFVVDGKRSYRIYRSLPLDEQLKIYFIQQFHWEISFFSFPHFSFAIVRLPLPEKSQLNNLTCNRSTERTLEGSLPPHETDEKKKWRKFSEVRFSSAAGWVRDYPIRCTDGAKMTRRTTDNNIFFRRQ